MGIDGAQASLWWALPPIWNRDKTELALARAVGEAAMAGPSDQEPKNPLLRMEGSTQEWHLLSPPTCLSSPGPLGGALLLECLTP